MYPGGTVVRVKPTVSATAYDANDVLFLTTEIPNAVSNRGGVSRLVGISIIDQADQGKNVTLLFMENQVNLIGAISPGSSGGVSITDDNVEAANILAALEVDFSANNFTDLVTSRMCTLTNSNSTSANGNLPIMLKAAPNSRSVYFAGIATEATDLAAVDDLVFVFHIEYID